MSGTSWDHFTIPHNHITGVCIPEVVSCSLDLTFSCQLDKFLLPIYSGLNLVQ